MIRFRFALRPLADVPPWGGDRPTLHWFGLTAGWYWVEVDGLDLLRYRDDTVRRWRSAGYQGPPYPDYYVVRLWEDLLVLLPSVREPVPDELGAFIEGDSRDWVERDFADDRTDAAVSWYCDRSLDLGYLRAAPAVRCWRTRGEGGDTVTVDWRNPSAATDDDVRFDGPAHRRLTVPTADLVAAVRDLDRELLAAMEERVTELERRGGLPGVELDLGLLRTEHRDRATWLRAARRRRPGTDWSAVRAGAALLHGH